MYFGPDMCLVSGGVIYILPEHSRYLYMRRRPFPVQISCLGVEERVLVPCSVLRCTHYSTMVLALEKCSAEFLSHVLNTICPGGIIPVYTRLGRLIPWKDIVCIKIEGAT
jgi:hypothetical protein